MPGDYPRPCKCGSHKLEPCWDEASGKRWVLCKDCGNQSRKMKGVPTKIVAQWNKEQRNGSRN